MRKYSLATPSIVLLAAVLLNGCGLLHRHHYITAAYQVTVLEPLPGGSYSQASDINSHGEVVGRATFAKNHGHEHATQWKSSEAKDTDSGAKIVPTDLGTLDACGSEADRISDGGKIAGWSSFQTLTIHPVVFSDKGPQDLGAGDGTIGMADGVNDAGVTVLTADTKNGEERSFINQNGHEVDLGMLPGMRNITANNLAANGVVVGTADNAAGTKRAFTWANGALTALALPSGYTNSYAAASNKAGIVAGACSIGQEKFRAAMWSTNTPSLLDAPATKDSEAFAINDKGDIVGECNNHAVIWRRDKLIDLNTKIGPHTKLVLNAAVAVNNVGQIVCNGSLYNQPRAFLLTPSGVSKAD